MHTHVGVLLTLTFAHLANKLALGFISCQLPLGQETLNYLAHRRPYFYNTTAASQQQYIPPGCNPVRFWYFGRHGSRNPGPREVDSMIKILPTLHKELSEAIKQKKNKLCPESQELLLNWTPRPDLKIEDAALLIEQGRLELKQIGRRFKKRFPNLFPAKFSNDTYLFKNTGYQRTEESAKAFADGIFGPDNDLWMPPAQKMDPILTFYAACPKYIEEIDNDPKAVEELVTFLKSTIINDTISRISNVLGLKRNLTLKEVTVMYRTCAFDTAWKLEEISPWCDVFSLEDFKVFMYSEDLEYYLRDGYGHKINYEIACTPFVDLIDYFRGYISNPESDKRHVEAYFSHSEAVLKMITRLDVFPTIPLTGSNYEKMKNYYTWKTSKIDIMATNLAFTLFKCTRDYQIGFYFQEIPQPFPACNGKPFCSFNQFHQNVKKFVDNCDLEKICHVNSRGVILSDCGSFSGFNLICLLISLLVFIKLFK